jgi:hypothetical protein
MYSVTNGHYSRYEEKRVERSEGREKIKCSR